MESLDDREKNLLLFVVHLLDVHDSWIQSDFEPLPETFEKAADGLVEIFAAGTIPADCRVLADRVVSFGLEWEKWKAGGALSGEVYPESNAFWRALEDIRDAKSGASDDLSPPPPLEPIAELERQKVGDAQICAIYGWGILNRPNMKKLAEERAKPGTHTGEGFVSPVHQEWVDREKRLQDHVENIRRLREAKVAPAALPAPESLPELLEQGISGKQIAAMLGKTVDEVNAECDRLKMPRPTGDYKDPRFTRAPHEPGIPEPVERAMDAAAAKAAPLTLDQEIIELHQQHNDAKAIAELLSTPDVQVSGQKVGSVIRRFTEHPEAFASQGG